MALPERGPPEQGLAHLFVTTVQQRSLSQRLRVGLLEAEGVSGFENIEARARGRSFVDNVKQRDHCAAHGLQHTNRAVNRRCAVEDSWTRN